MLFPDLWDKTAVHRLALPIGCYVGGGGGGGARRAPEGQGHSIVTLQRLLNDSVCFIYSCYSETSAAATTGDIKDSLNEKKKKDTIIQLFRFQKRKRVSNGVLPNSSGRPPSLNAA